MGGSLVFGDVHEGAVGLLPVSVTSQLLCGEHLVHHVLTIARFCLTTVPKAVGQGPWPETPESVLLFCYRHGKLINVKPRMVFAVWYGSH